METIFFSTNNVGSMMKYAAGTTDLTQQTLNENIGTCGALSSRWIRNMLDSPRIEMTKPDAALAAVIACKSWVREGTTARRKRGHHVVGQRTHALLEYCDLTELNFHTFHSLIDFLKHVRDNFGFYLAEMSEGHYIAAANLTMNEGQPNYFLYDSNQALFKSTDGADYYRSGSMKLAKSNWSIHQEVWVSEVASA